MASLLGGLRALLLSLGLVELALAQCYYGPGAQYQVEGLVPCGSGESACCLAGDTCLAGNACFNYKTGNTYQYGCTDITYSSDVCPYKCGWSPDQSPWVALEYCDDVDGAEDTWACHSPESCRCDWRSTNDLLHLPRIGCSDMGYLARVGVYGPNPLLPYALLPSNEGGSTGYFSYATVSGTVVASPSTAVASYTPDPTPGPTTYATPPPREIVKIDPNADPSPSAGTAYLITGISSGLQPPIPITGPLAATSSFPADFLAGVTTGLGGGNSGGNNGGNSAGSTSTGNGNNSPSSTGASGGSGSSGGPSSNDNSGGGGGGGGDSLSTGSKVGIGVGIAGGVCLIAAIALTFWALRRRKQQPDGPRPQDPDYAQGYHEKTHDSYNLYTSEAPATYYDAERRGSPSPGVYEAPYHTPQEEEAVKNRLSPLGPQELAGSPVAEMESGSTTPNRSPRIGHS